MMLRAMRAALCATKRARAAQRDARAICRFLRYMPPVLLCLRAMMPRLICARFAAFSMMPCYAKDAAMLMRVTRARYKRYGDARFMSPRYYAHTRAHYFSMFWCYAARVFAARMFFLSLRYAFHAFAFIFFRLFTFHYFFLFIILMPFSPLSPLSLSLYFSITLIHIYWLLLDIFFDYWLLMFSFIFDITFRLLFLRLHFHFHTLMSLLSLFRCHIIFSSPLLSFHCRFLSLIILLILH